MSLDTADDDLNLLDDLLTKAKSRGADGADGVLARSISLSHAQRLGEIEKLEREESFDLGLRVFRGKKQAVVSSTDLSAEALDELVDRALAMAGTVPDDPWCGLADPDQLTTSIPELDMVDSKEPSGEELIAIARTCEDAARAVEGITNSDGAEAGWSHSQVALAATNGFSGGYARTDFGMGVSVIAGEGTDMEGDYDYSQAVFAADLADPATIGTSAGTRAVSHLGGRKMPTISAPVVFDPRIAGGLLGHLMGAINGPSVARGTSFLKDSLGKAVFAPGINIVDDPHRPRGLRSKPFDGEGLENAKLNLVEDGVLTTWLLDLASARQLGMTSSGRASRGTSAPPSPSPTNLYLEAGTQTPDELMADIESGFYITSLMGMGVNGVTGDYSRGASGFWIEGGKRAFPVTEMTIAGNLKDMFRNLVPANDLVFRYGTNSPTVRIDGMTVAGGS
ncbi:MAG: TldD/PmbA family protein [Alphaproteobacteria bacterium]|nr:TldD/PmbA family protein [Alphaproteobacteria bacterium]